MATYEYWDESRPEEPPVGTVEARGVREAAEAAAREMYTSEWSDHFEITVRDASGVLSDVSMIAETVVEFTTGQVRLHRG
jgi:hypothetical protein